MHRSTAEDQMTTKATFDAAVTHMKNVQLGNQNGSNSTSLPKATLLRLYGCYKQACQGDVTGIAPSRFSVIAYAKWQAWNEMEGTLSSDARQQYVDLIAHIDPSFQPAQQQQQDRSEIATTSDTTTGAQDNDNLAAFSDSLYPIPPLVRSGSVLVYTGYTCIVSAAMLLTVSYIPPFALILIGLSVVGIWLILQGVRRDLEMYGLLAYMSPFTREMLLNMTLLEWCLDDSVIEALKEQWREIVPVFVQSNMTELLEALSNMSLTKRRIFTEKGIITILPASWQRIVLSEKVYDERQAEKQFRPALEAGPAEAIERQRTDELAPAMEDQEQLQARLMQGKLVDMYENVVTKNVSQMACQRTAVAGAMLVFVQMCVSARTRRLMRSLARALAVMLPGLGAVGGAVLWVLIALQKKKRRRLEAEAERRRKLVEG